MLGKTLDHLRSFGKPHISVSSSICESDMKDSLSSARRATSMYATIVSWALNSKGANLS